jgi:ubiquinone/menaquinone biosynthesis C-methylase UbiE
VIDMFFIRWMSNPVLLACVLLSLSCGSSPARPQGSAATATTEAFIAAQSDSVLQAFDRADVNGFSALTDNNFLHFEGGKPTDRAAELEQLSKRPANAPHVGERTWTEQHVYVQQQTATFFGKATERAAGNDTHGGYTYEGWYTLTWTRRVGPDWKLLLWTWQSAGAAAARDRWNEIYRNATGFNKQPNQLLVDAVAKRKPGTALDVAQGEGRNGLFLAQQGWQVTGVDFSDEGLRVARARADQLKVPLTTINADLAQFDYGVDKWDLVAMIYALDDPAALQKIKRSIKPGGLLVIEFFHSEEAPGKVDDNFARGELAKLFANEFDIIQDEVVEAVPDWAMDRASLVRFVAIKKTR